VGRVLPWSWSFTMIDMDHGVHKSPREDGRRGRYMRGTVNFFMNRPWEPGRPHQEVRIQVDGKQIPASM
jgi:hypothetical protein